MRKLMQAALLGILLWSCNPKEKVFFSSSQKVADTFYEALKAGKFADITTLLDSATFATDPPANWILLLKNKQRELGNLKSFVKKEEKQKPDKSELLLKYEVIYEKDTTFELLGIRLTNNKVHINQYQYGNTEAEIESKWLNF